jgi:cell shape-determining protein MreC
MDSGPVMSINVLQVLYGVLHAIEDKKQFSFISKLLAQAIENTSFAFSQLREMDNEVDRLRADNERLRRLFSNPPSSWSDGDKRFASGIKS